MGTQDDEVVTGNEPGGGPSFPAYEIRKRPSQQVVENFARAFFEGWQVGIGATGEFPCPLNLNGEPPAIDVSDKARGYRQIADLFILSVRATAQAARGLPIGEAYVKALDEKKIRTEDAVWLDGVVDGARARLRPSLTRCKQARRGISIGDVESEEVYMLEWHTPTQPIVTRKSKRKQKKPPTEKYTHTGSVEPKVETGPYARQKRTPLIRPASDPEDTLVSQAATEDLEPPGSRTVSDPGPFQL